jgi:hypothetical protein
MDGDSRLPVSVGIADQDPRQAANHMAKKGPTSGGVAILLTLRHSRPPWRVWSRLIEAFHFSGQRLGYRFSFTGAAAAQEFQDALS